MIGFTIGAFNMLVLAPKFLGPELLGLTRVISDAGITLATLATLGSIPVIYKFYPFYNGYLPPKKNDLPFYTGLICVIGFLLICVAGYFSRDLIERKYIERAPLFVEYSYLVYPFCFFMVLFMWLESFGWSFKKSVLTNGLRELLPRVLFTVITIFLALELVGQDLYMVLFALSYTAPGIILFVVLRRTGKFHFVNQPSNVTRRMGKRMMNFGLFVFGAHFLNLISRTIDTFILASVSDRGLVDTAVYTIATYVVTLMEVPQRSLNAATIPVLAESWKNKDLRTIASIYKKSVSNLLIIGLAMLSLFYLNIHNLESYLGEGFEGVGFVILVIGLGKLVDLGTGANAQIIGTSSYWKVDFLTNMLYTMVALPMNYILISKFGLKGAAYSSLISIVFYNILRYGFLYFKFGLQPYTSKNLLVLGISIGCTLVILQVPVFENLFIDAGVRVTLFGILFLTLIYVFRISSEINQTIGKVISNLKSLINRS
ncbi:MAG TPA: lipopolysaccharide biosynthesis protein [Flavihumibacter sp.]